MQTSTHNGNNTDAVTKALIAAMVEADFTRDDVAKRLHVSDKTVTAVCRADSQNFPPPAVVTALKKRLGDKFAVKADNLLDAIDATKLAKMSGYQLMIAAATAVDKMLLLDGKPTQIHAVALFQQVRDDQAALKNELDYMKDAIDVPAI